MSIVSLAHGTSLEYILEYSTRIRTQVRQPNSNGTSSTFATSEQHDEENEKFKSRLREDAYFDEEDDDEEEEKQNHQKRLRDDVEEGEKDENDDRELKRRRTTEDDENSLLQESSSSNNNGPVVIGPMPPSSE